MSGERGECSSNAEKSPYSCRKGVLLPCTAASDCARGGLSGFTLPTNGLMTRAVLGMDCIYNAQHSLLWCPTPMAQKPFEVLAWELLEYLMI